MNNLKQILFLSLSTIIALFILLLIPMYLLSGGNPNAPFLYNEVLSDGERLTFITLFPVAYTISTVICIRRLSLPTADYFNKIIFTNLTVYVLLGLLLSVIRIPLFSRVVFLSELILSTIFLVSLLFLFHKKFPRRIGLLSNLKSVNFQRLTPIHWLTIDSVDNDLSTLDGAIFDSRDINNKHTAALLANLTLCNVPIYEDKQILEWLTGRVSLDRLTNREFDEFSRHQKYFALKRLVDLGLTFVLALPIVITTCIIAVAIKLDSPGPVLFWQKRIGHHGKTFSMCKFRSMHSSEQTNSSQFALKNDKRITRVGRILRRTRVDELPQFWNVLLGDMSVIGPRPEQPEFSEQFRESIPFYGFRQTVRPGITGWAQIKQGYAADEEETKIKLEYDFYYIKYLSWWLEAVIVFSTLKTILLGFGHR